MTVCNLILRLPTPIFYLAENNLSTWYGKIRELTNYVLHLRLPLHHTQDKIYHALLLDFSPQLQNIFWACEGWVRCYLCVPPCDVPVVDPEWVLSWSMELMLSVSPGNRTEELLLEMLPDRPPGMGLAHTPCNKYHAHIVTHP